MITLEDALKQYACTSDWEALVEYRSKCENLADEITKLMCLTERLGSGLLKGTMLGPTWSAARMTCYERNTQVDKVIIKSLELIDFAYSAECYEHTLTFLRKSPLADLLHPALSCYSIVNEIGLVNWLFTTDESTWRRIRSCLWWTSDNLFWFTQVPVEARICNQGHNLKTRPLKEGSGFELAESTGRPTDLASWNLLRWAKEAEQPLDELTRTLVSENLDRNRNGSNSVRIRREKKRLAVIQKSITQSDQKLLEMKKRCREARTARFLDHKAKSLTAT